MLRLKQCVLFSWFGQRLHPSQQLLQVGSHLLHNSFLVKLLDFLQVLALETQLLLGRTSNLHALVKDDVLETVGVNAVLGGVRQAGKHHFAEFEEGLMREEKQLLTFAHNARVQSLLVHQSHGDCIATRDHQVHTDCSLPGGPSQRSVTSKNRVQIVQVVCKQNLPPFIAKKSALLKSLVESGIRLLKFQVE